MEIIEKIKLTFQNWYLKQRNKFLMKEISRIPSDNIDDYFFDTLTKEFVYKENKVPRLTDNRILRVSPEINSIIYDEYTLIGSITPKYIHIEKEGVLFNRADISFVVLGADLEVWIKVRYSETDNVFITLENFVLPAGFAYIFSFDLPTSVFFNLELQLDNDTGKSIVNYCFMYAEPIKQTLDTIQSQLDKLTFDGSNKLICVI